MALIRLSVSQLKFACVNPAWRERWLKGQNPSTRPIPALGTPVVYGRLFHSLAHHFTNWLTKPTFAKKTRSLTDGDRLWEALFEQSAGTRLKRLLNAGQLEEADALQQRLRSFCDRLAQLRRERPGFQRWSDLLVATEHPVRNVAYPIGDHTLFLSGNPDALRLTAEQELVIVDYKLTAGAHLQHDLVQLALYASLLEKTRPGLRFHGLLELYQPGLHTVEVAAKELRAIFNNVIVPVMHGMLPDTVSHKSFSTSAPAPPAEAHDRGDDIRHCFAGFRLAVTVTGKQEAPQLTRYRIRPGSGVKVTSLQNRAEDLQVALALPQVPLIEPSQEGVTIDIPREKPITVPWPDLQARPEVAQHPSPVSFPLGLGVSNEVMMADFQDPNTAHALVAGASGSGKSEFLKSMCASLIARNSPETLRLTLVDPKILTFGPLRESPHLTEPVITELPAAIACLENAITEMDRRYLLLAQENFENLSQRFQAGKRGLPWHLLIFDEFADLILAGKAESAQFGQLVARVAAKGRAAGIHLVLATQRPDSKIVTGLIKANLPLKVCLRVSSVTNSRIILDEGGGESLLGRGDLLYNSGRGLSRAQSPYIPPSELASLISVHSGSITRIHC